MARQHAPLAVAHVAHLLSILWGLHSSSLLLPVWGSLLGLPSVDNYSHSTSQFCPCQHLPALYSIYSNLCVCHCLFLAYLWVNRNGFICSPNVTFSFFFSQGVSIISVVTDAYFQEYPCLGQFLISSLPIWPLESACSHQQVPGNLKKLFLLLQYLISCENLTCKVQVTITQNHNFLHIEYMI